jgi:hypothetical protein
MLLAFAYVYEAEAQDDAIDLLHQLITTSLRRAERKGEAGRLETIGDLDAAALRLRDAVRIILDPGHADESVRAAIFGLIARSQLEQDVATVGMLSRAEQENRYSEHLLYGYSQLRRFLPALLRSIPFRAALPASPYSEPCLSCARRKGKIG